MWDMCTANESETLARNGHAAGKEAKSISAGEYLQWRKERGHREIGGCSLVMEQSQDLGTTKRDAGEHEMTTTIGHNRGGLKVLHEDQKSDHMAAHRGTTGRRQKKTGSTESRTLERQGCYSATAGTRRSAEQQIGATRRVGGSDAVLTCSQKGKKTVKRKRGEEED